MLNQHSEIPARIIELISDPRNDILVSAATAWEIAIKAVLGKISLPQPSGRFIEEQLVSNGFTELPVTTRHALHTMTLPVYPDHKDPFDRILIAQSNVEDVALLTNDRLFRRYTVRVIW